MYKSARVLWINYGIPLSESEDMDPLKAETLLMAIGAMNSGDAMRQDYLQAEHLARVNAAKKR